MVFEDRIEDIEKLILTYYREILKLFSRYKPSEIIADYTSGTKPMSAALSVLAIDLNLAELNYITGIKRDFNGRVITGMERGYQLSPTVYNCVKTIVNSIDLFNRKLPLAAYTTIKSCYVDKRYENFFKLTHFFTAFFNAYNLWDSFHHREAKEQFKELMREYKNIAKELGLKKEIQKSIEIWEKANPPYHPYFALDIFANAKRRAYLGRLDDAVARLYRVIEYIAQLRLSKFNIKTDDVSIDRFKNSEVRKRFKDRSTPIKIGLTDSYFVLAKEFNDDLGIKFLREFESGLIKKFLNNRNYSILAHGLKPIKESSVSEFFNYVEKEFIITIVGEKDFDSLFKLFYFPEISKEKILYRILDYV